MVQIRFILVWKFSLFFYLLIFYLNSFILLRFILDTLMHFNIRLFRIQKHKIDSSKIHFYQFLQVQSLFEISLCTVDRCDTLIHFYIRFYKIHEHKIGSNMIHFVNYKVKLLSWAFNRVIAPYCPLWNFWLLPSRSITWLGCQGFTDRVSRWDFLSIVCTDSL